MCVFLCVVFVYCVCMHTCMCVHYIYIRMCVCMCLSTCYNGLLLLVRYKGTAHAFRSIVQEHGVRGLWRGAVPNSQRAALACLGGVCVCVCVCVCV